MEKYGKISCFSGRIWPDWGNTARADMDGLGSIGFRTRGGGRLGSKFARMCVSKSEGHGSFLGFKGVK